MSPSQLPLVTVILPSYNHGSFISECLAGILTQTYSRIELIVIDDGSSDDSVSRIEAIAASCRERFERFTFVARENRGLCSTLNEALAWAQGEYVATSDSDDILMPNHIQTLIGEIENEPQVNGVYGGAVLIGEDGSPIGMSMPKARYYSFIEILSRDKAMTSSGGLLRTSALRAVGGYRDGLYIEDWYIMLRLTQSGSRLKTVPKPVVRYRIHNTNISKNFDKMFQARIIILNMFATYPGHSKREALVRTEAALDCWRSSRIKAIHYLLNAVIKHATIMTEPLFLAALGRIITPTPIVDFLKRRRLACAARGASVK